MVQKANTLKEISLSSPQEPFSEELFILVENPTLLADTKEIARKYSLLQLD